MNIFVRLTYATYMLKQTSYLTQKKLGYMNCTYKGCMHFLSHLIAYNSKNK